MYFMFLRRRSEVSAQPVVQLLVNNVSRGREKIKEKETVTLQRSAAAGEEKECKK